MMSNRGGKQRDARASEARAVGPTSDRVVRTWLDQWRLRTLLELSDCGLQQIARSEEVVEMRRLRSELGRFTNVRIAPGGALPQGATGGPVKRLDRARLRMQGYETPKQQQ